MVRLNKVEWHVMDAMADDWESVDQIRPHVTEYCGQTPDQTILEILRQLHEVALLRIMDADGYGADRFPENARDHWFSMTDSGREVWDAEGREYRDEEKTD